ncbi:hypothetical protein RND81_12G138400 [Saponaria officinalis]
MRIVKRADFDVPEWRVTGFSNHHNHELSKSAEVHILPTQCLISSDDKTRICMFAKAGISVRQMLRLMELEKGVKLGCLPFSELDIRNLLQSFRHVDKDSDPVDLIGVCKRWKDENPDFKYDYKLDNHNRLEHIAWSYPSSIQQYEGYGDAVVFDTTHRLDAYDMLLGLLIGVNNHGIVCLYGCVLLRDENLPSFAWALTTFLCFMKGKAPQTILTDHNTWLKEAIAAEMPATKHAFCIWHIMANFSDWFSDMLGFHYDDLKAEFYRLYNLEMVEKFEDGWKDMVCKYGLQTNKHIVGLYALRNFWALSFLRRYFFAGLTCKSVIDSVNAFIQRILSSQAELEHFIDKVASIAEYNDQTGLKLKTQQKLQKVSVETGSPMESHASNVLTPYAFSMLQEELVLAPQFASVLVNEGCFHVRHHTQINEGCKVTWDPRQGLINCTCHQFEFLGIVCRHILRVLSTNNCFHIPDQYLPYRWSLLGSSSYTKHFRDDTPPKEQVEKVHIFESLLSSVVSESLETRERLDIACEQMFAFLSDIKQLPRSTNPAKEDEYTNPTSSLILHEVEDADGSIAQSFTLGNFQESFVSKLRERKPSSSIDILRKRRRCSIPCCGQLGHDASDCLIVGSDSLHGDRDTLGFL